MVEQCLDVYKRQTEATPARLGGMGGRCSGLFDRVLVTICHLFCLIPVLLNVEKECRISEKHVYVPKFCLLFPIV